MRLNLKSVLCLTDHSVKARPKAKKKKKNENSASPRALNENPTLTTIVPGNKMFTLNSRLLTGTVCISFIYNLLFNIMED